MAEDKGFKLWLAFIAMIGFCFAMLMASQVGIERAQAARECFKAAQINQNIQCERGIEP